MTSYYFPPPAFTLDRSAWETIRQQFVGGSAQLRHPEMTSSGVDRYRLNTVSMGTVHLSLGLILRNFDKYGIEF